MIRGPSSVMNAFMMTEPAPTLRCSDGIALGPPDPSEYALGCSHCLTSSAEAPKRQSPTRGGSMVALRGMSPLKKRHGGCAITGLVNSLLTHSVRPMMPSGSQPSAAKRSSEGHP